MKSERERQDHSSSTDMLNYRLEIQINNTKKISALDIMYNKCSGQ